MMRVYCCFYVSLATRLSFFLSFFLSIFFLLLVIALLVQPANSVQCIHDIREKVFKQICAILCKFYCFLLFNSCKFNVQNSYKVFHGYNEIKAGARRVQIVNLWNTRVQILKVCNNEHYLVENNTNETKENNRISISLH